MSAELVKRLRGTQHTVQEAFRDMREAADLIENMMVTAKADLIYQHTLEDRISKATRVLLGRDDRG